MLQSSLYFVVKRYVVKFIVVMVHNQLNEKILSRQLNNHPWKEPIQIISVPMPVRGQSQVMSIQRLKSEIADKVDYNNVCAFIIESNYGFASEEMVAFDIIQFGESAFVNAKIIAYSSTQSSLVMAAKLGDNMSVCHSMSDSVDVLQDIFARSLGLQTEKSNGLRDRLFTKSLVKELTTVIDNEYLNESKPYTLSLAMQRHITTDSHNLTAVNDGENEIENKRKLACIL